MIKLNFCRFMDMEQLRLPLDVDTGNTKAKTKEYKQAVEQNVISTNEQAIASMDKVNAKTENAWSGKALKGVRDGIRRYKQELSKMKELAATPYATPKFKQQVQTAVMKDEITGMSGYKIKDASSIPKGNVNKLITAGERIAKQNITEMAKQQRQEALATDEATTSFLKQNNVLSKFNTAMNAATTATDNLSKSFKAKIASLKHAAVSWRILYGVFNQIWNMLSGTVEKAAAYQEALNLYTVALDSYAEEGSKWAEKISGALYLDPKQIMQYTGAFYNLVQGLGVASDAAYKMSTNLTQLSYDMSSYLNIDVEAAHDKLQSAITGQSRAVASAGIAMQQASLQELAYSLGIDKTVSSMTQAEKTYLRYIQIMRSTTNMQGDLARTIVTPENAIRVVKQQFELLARAIGNVFIPIVMSAIPYVMALTKALTMLANKLASMLGFKIAEIDYSSLKTADTAIEETFDNIGTSVGNGAKAVGDGVNRTLAAFDELNVVESKNKGAGGGGIGGIGGGDSIIPDLEKYIDGYDMLQGLTDELSKRTDAAYENLKKLWNVIKGIGVAFLAWKGLKLANTVLKWADAFIEAYNAGKGIPGLFKHFVDGFKTAKLNGDGFFTSMVAGFRNILGPVGKFVVSIGTVVTAFTSSLNIMKNWNGEMDDLGRRILSTTAIVGGLSAAAFLLVSPFAAGATAVAGLTGGILGFIKAKQQYDAELEKAEAYDKLFSGVGISIDTIIDSFKGLTNEINIFYNELDNAYYSLENTTGELKTAQAAFFELHNAFIAGVDDDTTFNKLTASVQTFKDKIYEARDANIEYHTVILNNLLSEGRITKEEYTNMKNTISDYYSKMALYTSQYGDELTKLDTQLKTGYIKQDEYNEKVAELEKKYAGVITNINLSGSSVEKLYAVYGRDIDFKNEKEVLKLFEDLTTIYEDERKNIEEQRKQSDTYFNEQIAHNELLIKDLEKRRDSWSDIDRDIYNTATENLATLRTEQKKQNEQYMNDLTTLDAQYGNYLATINAKLVASGSDLVDGMDEVYLEVRDKLLKITKDTDITNAPNDLFGNWTAQFLANGKKLGNNAYKIFGDVGINVDEALFYNMYAGLDKGFINYQNDLDRHGEATKHKLNKTYADTGGEASSTLTQSMIDGYIANIPKVNTTFEEHSKEIGYSVSSGIMEGYDDTSVNKYYETKMGEVETTCKNRLDIHSPSGVFKEIGRNIMLGLYEGINENTGTVKGKLDSFMNEVLYKTQNTHFSFNFNTNVESSFNTLLHKLQSFSDKWRTAINDMLNKTAKAFASIALTSANKVKYTVMDAIRVPTFAEGGYPTSGDLFYANENGIPEYITTLGNKSAVVNQDQMVTALTNAITTALGTSSGNNRQPNHIIVQIGNEKVYEGQGKYQNRQADRYGTTYVKI